MDRMKYTDEELLEILYEIDRKVSNVSKFEADFIESNLERNQPYFSEPQREIIHEMMEKYL